MDGGLGDGFTIEEFRRLRDAIQRNREAIEREKAEEIARSTEEFREESRSYSDKANTIREEGRQIAAQIDETKTELAKIEKLQKETKLLADKIKLSPQVEQLTKKLSELSQKNDRLLKDFRFYQKLAKDKQEETLDEESAAGKFDKNHQERVALLKAKLQQREPRIDVNIEVRCPGNSPHLSTHDSQLRATRQGAEIERGVFAAKLLQELHGYLNDARYSPTMCRLLRIDSLAPDSKSLWMVGVLLCLDSRNEIRILCAASGKNVKSNSAKWCPLVKNFTNFCNNDGSKTLSIDKMQEICLEQRLTRREITAQQIKTEQETIKQLGKCAAPKMLSQAASGGLIPFQMAESGFCPSSEGSHGKLYNSCDYCKFGLGFWLDGLPAKQRTAGNPASVIEKGETELFPKAA